ncbi:hypothetical protein SKTS_16600 [Sulfurimicrobium lacus]|uniref:Glycosaminoglycan attachment site n=1 Tax=Sulfurimicrobium lacus TaxID=2715678 RepID=A0A6F8VAT6_9PROT|nr:hypothetical protein [Sulfurimicrobium lacus]BCB26774.1 hypothetical protein SKTS_16600 [Sulfurimicrobium lacus]
MDLFTPVVDEARFHPNFRNILVRGRTAERAELARWADGFPDRDGKFVHEFQTTFNSCFWELYLFAVFKDYGHSLDWSNASPDFSICAEGLRFTVEAVTANSAVGKPAEWERTVAMMKSKPDLNALNREAIIRLSNSFLGKVRQYSKHYAKLPHVARHPFVLAIAPFEQPLFNLQYNRPITALLYDYYVDEQEFIESPEKYPAGPPGKSLGFVEKDNGAEIQLGFFNDDQFSEISAVIFSCTATWGKVDAMCGPGEKKRVIHSVWGSPPIGAPTCRTATAVDYSEVITDGLQVYHNPHAKHPLSPAVFRRTGVTQVFYDDEQDEWVREEVNNSLFWRQVFSFTKDEEQVLDPVQ